VERPERDIDLDKIQTLRRRRAITFAGRTR